MAVKEMSPEARALRNAYMREHYRKNKERERNRQVDYWERKAKELKKKEMDETLQRLEEAWEEPEEQEVPEVTNTFENMMLILCRYGRDGSGIKKNIAQEMPTVWLEEEPENEHDKDAIAVYVNNSRYIVGEWRFGYIAKEYTQILKPILKNPYSLTFTNNFVICGDGNKKGVLLEIRY